MKTSNKQILVYEHFSGDKPYKIYSAQINIVIKKTYFTILEQIGGGGESYVFKIESNKNGEIYALKVSKKPHINKKFKNEIEIAKKFSSSEFKNNFITYIMDGDIEFTKKTTTTKHLCYVMDIANKTFEEYLCHDMQWTHERDILPTIKELALSVKILHDKNYVHRDIKPQNILVYGGLFKLADFGMITQENENCYKAGPKYWPTPELLNMCDDDVHCSGKQTDVFMLGCMFYFIYTKKYPIGNIDMSSIDNEHEMKPIIQKMISHNIDDRYESAVVVYDEINKIRFTT